MRFFYILSLLVGVALAGTAVFMAQAYVAKSQAALIAERKMREDRGPMTELLVAKRDLPFGTEITAADVLRMPWPQAMLPQTAFKDTQTLFPTDGPKTRSALQAMVKFEPILSEKVSAPGEDAGIAARLSVGMRAFTIKVDLRSGVSGLLRPGDRVDVYWTGSANGAEFTKLIEPGVRLVAIDQSIKDEPNGKGGIAKTVTVEITPQQVAAFTQAQSTGQLTLSLVGVSDDSLAIVRDVDQKSLLGLTEPEAEIFTPAPKICTIRQRNGATVTEVPIPCPQ
jgi:pilus assembly protein CpaB